MTHEHKQILNLLNTWEIENIELAIQLSNGINIDISNEIQGMLDDFYFLTFPDGSVVKKIHWLINLTEFYCGHNQLTELPANIGQLTNLKALYCWGNQLTELPASIGKLSNLTELDCCENQLTALPTEIGQLTNLTEIDCWENDMPKSEIQKIKKLLPNCEVNH